MLHYEVIAAATLQYPIHGYQLQITQTISLKQVPVPPFHQNFRREVPRCYHPHIHCIVPGGGLDKRGVWHHIKGCKHTDFLFPVVAMSTKFRGRFMSLLTRRLKEKDIIIDQSIRKHCFAIAWVVNSKPPAKGVNQVLEYIGRYAYRVAITRSNLFAWLVQEFQDSRRD